MDIGNLDLGILLSYKLQMNWRGQLNMITVLDDGSQLEAAQAYLENLTQVARLPGAKQYVLEGDFYEVIPTAPQGDINIFGLPLEVDYSVLERLRKASRSACAFVQDAGTESALA